MNIFKLSFNNVFESGTLLDYDEYENLSEEQKNDYVTSDDFVDCDYIKVNNKTAIQFFRIDDKIFYQIYPEFEVYEDALRWIIDKFFRDDYKTAFYEVDTAENVYNATDYYIYQENLKKGIVLFYRGGAGYTYGVHILEPLNYMDSLHILNWFESDKPEYPQERIKDIKTDANRYLFEMVEK